jgi:dihydrofolate reductase
MTRRGVGVRVVMIAAVSRDGFISRGTGVPWELPADREHFRRCTAGQWLLLGRRTFEEMRGWFKPGHVPLVLTARPMGDPWSDSGVRSVEEAMARAAAAGARELWVCGGASVYAAALPWADEVILTEVDELLGAGVPFPRLERHEWRVARSLEAPVDLSASHALRFHWRWYQRHAAANESSSGLAK